MSTLRVVLTDKVFPDTTIEQAILREIGAELIVADGTSSGVLAAASSADGLLNTYFRLDERIIRQLNRCRVIARYGIGVDNIDLNAARDAGIVVTNVPDYCVEEVASHALAMILGLIRRLSIADGIVRQGEWSIDRLRPIHRVSTLVVGLVGFGRIAQRLATAMSALGAEVLAFDPYVAPPPAIATRVSFEELLRRSDVVSIHAPLTRATQGLFNRKTISFMKPGAILVNTARGGLVEIDAVLDALRGHRLSGAALDVFEPEPLDPRLVAGVPNLIVTPHMSYYSEESVAESQTKAARQVALVLSGAEPEYPV